MNSRFPENGSQHFDDESDEKILSYLLSNKLKIYNLENHLLDHERCVHLRQKYYNEKASIFIGSELTNNKFDYSKIFQRCCENVIGYITIPVGLVGPIFMNEKSYYVPMATTEGCLVASTNRGARCISNSGASAILVDDGMTRAPVLRADSIFTAVEAKRWIENNENFKKLQTLFNSTSRYGKLISVKCIISGPFLYVRFKATTGEAMGMNMVSKGTESAISAIISAFPKRLKLLGLSGNLCTDKKCSSINWTEGRGKSVVCEAEISRTDIKSVLHVDPEDIVELSISKNLVGSAMACSIGGQNANAANVVAAIFAATGQDLAQVVESSQCLTFLEMRNDFLYISCTMPCIEVGTAGGGTFLSAQSACRKIMNLDCDSDIFSSANLALIICTTVLCSELSLLAALSSDSLVSSHMKFNRIQSI